MHDHDDYRPSPIEAQLARREESIDWLARRHSFETLAGALRTRNTEKRNATETTCRQLLVAILVGRRYERAQIAELLGYSTKTIERDLVELDRILSGQRAAAMGDVPGVDLLVDALVLAEQLVELHSLLGGGCWASW